jgi:hypothetical protein
VDVGGRLGDGLNVVALDDDLVLLRLGLGHLDARVHRHLSCELSPRSKIGLAGAGSATNLLTQEVADLDGLVVVRNDDLCSSWWQFFDSSQMRAR